jgi:hypothetical protein
MSFWIVGVEAGQIHLGQHVHATFPRKYDREVIYYQGRPVPQLGPSGARFAGVATSIKRFADAQLVAVRLLVEGQYRAGDAVQYWHTRLLPA